MVESAGLYDGGVLGYMVESVVLPGGDCCDTWGCWITWKGVLSYLVIFLLGCSHLILVGEGGIGKIR